MAYCRPWSRGPLSIQPSRVAIIGGGPGGLLTAYRLQQRCDVPFIATIYEASPRLGGKILTSFFASAPVTYEAGAAELYDYSRTGDDPLRQLIDDLGLPVRPMAGSAVILDDRVIAGQGDIRDQLGDDAWSALCRFDAEAKAWMTPRAFYEADWTEGVEDPKANESFESLLARVPNAAARRYLSCLVHSDLATEPHRTSASYGLQNYLMNDPDYLQLYTIDGGIERLPRELAARLSATIRLNEPVVLVERTAEGLLRLDSRRNGEIVSDHYDYVVVALPNDWLPAIDWRGSLLADAMHEHHMHYDHPAHYLRISILFREPFWRECVQGSYFMLDAFGGCCLYDESARNADASAGVLGWLLAGDAAMAFSNLSDDTLIRVALDRLPSFLRHGRDLAVEGKVHRWIGAVNGLPGGVPALDVETRHMPEPAEHRNLFLVGDYLFDSTLNGVLDSADYVVEWLAEEMQEGRDRTAIHTASAVATATS